MYFADPAHGRGEVESAANYFVTAMMIRGGYTDGDGDGFMTRGDQVELASRGVVYLSVTVFRPRVQVEFLDDG